MSASDTTREVLSTRIGKLTSALSVSVLGYDFLSNPESFILAVIYREVMNTVLGIAGETGALLIEIWEMLTDAVVGGLAYALGAPGRVIGGLILDGIGAVDTFVADAVAAAGPFGILIAIGAWGAVTLGVIYGLAGAFRLYRLIRGTVI